MAHTPSHKVQGQLQGLRFPHTPISSLTNYTVTGPQHKSTPGHEFHPNEANENELELDDRCGLLTAKLEDLGTFLEFLELLDELDLESTYKDYEDTTGDVFNITDELMPAILAQAHVLCEKLGEKLAEKTYVKKLMGVVRLMHRRIPKVDALPKQYAQSPYNIFDRQNTSIDKSKLKPDVIFAFKRLGDDSFANVFAFLEAKGQVEGPEAARKTLSQLADYALALWKCQPTRTFVPVLFLQKCKLKLYVFTRSGYFWTDIGPVLFTDRCDIESLSGDIVTSLRRLWFILTLPAHKFGFLFGFWSIPRRLKIDASTIPATIDKTRYSDSTAVLVEKPISRPVRITGRCSYLFNAEYCGEKAVLKLTWTRTDRLPEGAVYRVLEAHGVSNVPKIYQSGVIIKDFDGYRLEFLVMEHCGAPIVAQIKNMTKDDWPVSQVDKLVKDSIRNVVETLTGALAADILHRDIFPGNIAIKDGAAYIIDWGCAKPLHPPADLTLGAEIAKHWSFDWDKVLATKLDKDTHSTTPFYTSARLLLKALTRSVYDDLESLFYTILDSLSDRPRTGKPVDQPLGFAFLTNASMAATRLTCTQSRSCFLKHFGVTLHNESTLGGVMDAMRRFLFFDNGTHLGGRILDKADFPRNFDDSAAKVFMSDKTARDLLSLVGGEKDPSPLAVEPATAIPSAQISVHDPKRASSPPQSFSSRFAKQATLGDDDNVGMYNIEEHFPTIDSAPVSPNSLGPGARVNTKLSEPSPSSRRNPAQPVKLLPAKNESRLSTPNQSSKTVVKKGTTQAGASRIPTRPTSHRNGAKSADDRKKATTQVGHTLIPTLKIRPSPSAISPNNSNVKASKAASLLKFSPRQTRSRTEASAIPRRSPTKENIGAVGKTKSTRDSSSKGANKRTGSTPPGGAAAKRQKY